MKSKIAKLNRYNDSIYCQIILKYSIVQTEGDYTLLKRTHIDKTDNYERDDGFIKVENWILDTYDITSLNFYINKLIEESKL